MIAAILKNYRLNRQALPNGLVLEWVEPKVCHCVKVRWVNPDRD